MNKNPIRKNLVILGATGSIGTAALQVCLQLADRIRVTGLAAGNSWEKLAQQVKAYDCQSAATADPAAAEKMRRLLPTDCQVFSGEVGMTRMCTAPETDMVLCAISGTAGLKPVLAAIEEGKDIALASKEILVMAGNLVMSQARKRGVRILPVDSEHSAIFQCLQGNAAQPPRRLILTASGGPFRNYSLEQLRRVKPRDALAHPTWNMGEKITIDSATLMNKGLELIEACRLFKVKAEKIEVILHPQSIVHSMVEMIDGSILAQMGPPDMRLPIQYALTYPERLNGGFPSLDFSQLSCLEFSPPRDEAFPALRLARRALAAGGTMPAVYNAANEAAVEAFRCGRIGFPDIARLVEKCMSEHSVASDDNLENILQADKWARDFTSRLCKTHG